MRRLVVAVGALFIVASDSISARAPAAPLPALPGLPALLGLPAPQVVTFESTVNQLNDADPAVRRQALRLLAEARYPEAAEPIATLLTDPEHELQLEAIAAEMHLFLVDPPGARRRVGLVFEQRGRVSAETIFAQGPLAVGADPVPDAVFTGLLAAMRDADRRVVFEATYAMAVLTPAGRTSAAWRGQAASDLASVLQHPEREHRLAALHAIGRVFAPGPGRQADPTAGDAVVHAMNDRQREVRIAAIGALGTLRYDRGLQALLDRFAAERSGQEADAAMRALAVIGHPSASPVFIDQLAAGSRERRRVAIEGLARTGPREVLGDIQARLLRDTDRSLALAAAFASARLAAGPMDPLLSALLQPDFDDQAFGYLVELVGPQGRVLAAYAQDPEPRIRTRMADAAALSGDLNTLPLVQALLRDPQPAVVQAAARAVSWLDQRR